MRTRLTSIWFWAFAFATLACTVSLFAQTNGVPNVDEAPLPKSVFEFWTYAIALITPLVVWGVSKIPNLPKAILPTITPFIGIGLGFAMKKLELANLAWVDMAQMGALAVFIREIFNQWVTKQLDGTAGKTPARPTVDIPGVELK